MPKFTNIINNKTCKVFCWLTMFSANVFAQSFSAANQPSAPDYASEKNWSALPFRKDEADHIPKSETWIDDSLKEVDVFYIYPTIFEKGEGWNADVNNVALNKAIDTKPVKYQAAVFNQSCRVYAPRYRQSHVKVFYDMNEDALKSLDFAYQDVKRAFQYYLSNYNGGRPFIIASHSQGTYHSRRLLREMIDTTLLKNRMVAAYCIGYAIDSNWYQVLEPCKNETSTGCYITWATFKKGYQPESALLYGNVCVNPLTWQTRTERADKVCSKGAILLDFNKKYNQAICAEIHDSYLWVETNLPFVSGMKNLHIADYNLFWYDIRENVKKRIAAFFKR